jgi:hypothetical protein
MAMRSNQIKENAMSFSTVLDVAISIVIAYYVLGLIVSFISGRVLEILETRGKLLEVYLKKIVSDKEVDLQAFNSLPQIHALKPIRYAGLKGLLRAKTEEKRVEKIPAETLVESVFDFFELASKKLEIPAEVQNLIDQLPGEEEKAALHNIADKGMEAFLNVVNKLPNSETKNSLQDWAINGVLIAKIDSIPACETKNHLQVMVQKGVTDLETMRARLQTWYGDLMRQASAEYKAHARRWVMLFAIVVTLLSGLDTLEYARDLWTNPNRREAAAALADQYVNTEVQDAELEPLIEELNELNMGLGWYALPEHIPTNGTTNQWISFILLKVVGLSITALAVSQGSSFWYDVLKKVSSTSSSK